jgi:hypothetical protein
MIRPWLSQRMRKEIEVESEEDSPAASDDLSQPRE